MSSACPQRSKTCQLFWGIASSLPEKEPDLNNENQNYLSLLSLSEFSKVKCPIQDSPPQSEPPIDRLSSMPPLVTKPVVMIDVIYSLHQVKLI